MSEWQKTSVPGSSRKNQSIWEKLNNSLLDTVYDYWEMPCENGGYRCKRTLKPGVPEEFETHSPWSMETINRLKKGMNENTAQS